MNRFVFADPNQCIGCRTCEVACVLSHQEVSKIESLDPSKFYPRLNLVRNGDVTTPIMCRQCEDAPCEQVCPNNAIYRENGQVHVIQSRCIGCKTCSVACPYGAMNVVAFPVEQQGPSELFKMNTIKAQALKCDLCGTRDKGPACVEVCPTNAIRLIEPQDMDQIKQDKRKQAAVAALAGVPA
ncbi:4Fe-4S dicluster domain-containing protein [Shewanella sp. WXL01]|uniref:4Fe-4S dicluster domain-containing protein n=1 Tax=Shewanella maritima TaxID=2520507 RepID=A0A411PJJ5_9GAMM|nr:MULTISPECIES: 4Fe-4S dicluster domain-containing protein [Shewanella]NKF50715.1 4Fe-4S dicluster domain-containing protein [Shewanella sp. WXL01]QBF83705.1 4Fe-4S dicluster domain-containing protein [Shewanella maritima]